MSNKFDPCLSKLQRDYAREGASFVFIKRYPVIGHNHDVLVELGWLKHTLIKLRRAAVDFTAPCKVISHFKG